MARVIRRLGGAVVRYGRYKGSFILPFLSRNETFDVHPRVLVDVINV